MEVKEGETLEEITQAFASLSREEREALAQLLCHIARNAEEIERVLELLIAIADLVEEVKPLLGELYSELHGALELAEGVDFGEFLEQLKARLEEEYHSSR